MQCIVTRKHLNQLTCVKKKQRKKGSQLTDFGWQCQRQTPGTDPQFEILNMFLYKSYQEKEKMFKMEGQLNGGTNTHTGGFMMPKQPFRITLHIRRGIINGWNAK